MDVIQLLPDSVANQIAAGEVIQRPASVIKELVENAIDAGATEISVLVCDAGKASIQVIDNGKGMSDTDARLSFERHATSKIRQAEDLFSLHTMGFRGEALASIAAVAQVTLQTRTEAEEIGTRIVVSASKVEEQEPVNCPVGANFLVENLFFNIPARRKFLKSNSTEMNNIMQAFERIVLVYPEVGFTLYSNGTEIKRLRKSNIHQRIVDIFGKRINQQLLPVNTETTLCSITGFIGKPESAKKKGVQQFFFVNGRYMKHPYFHKAVMAAYDRLIPDGDQIPYFIYLTVDPKDIDVNIHPVKTEIKFDNERDIWQILMAAARDAVGKFSDITTLDFDTVGKPDIPVFNPTAGVIEAPHIDFNPQYNPFEDTEEDNAPLSSSPTTRGTGTHAPQQRSAKGWEELFGEASDSKGIDNGMDIDNIGKGEFPYSDGISQEEPSPTLFHSGLSWGDTDNAPSTYDLQTKDSLNIDLQAATEAPHLQLRGSYITTQTATGLLIVDQNRASQRILFEQYMQSIRNNTPHTQRILFPEMVQFPPSYSASLNIILDELRAIGFEITDLGGGSYSIAGTPAGVSGLNTVKLVTELVDEAIETGNNATELLHTTIAAALARKAATPYGEVLSEEDMTTLLQQLFNCKTPKYTADGKPVATVITFDEIAQRL